MDGTKEFPHGVVRGSPLLRAVADLLLNGGRGGLSGLVRGFENHGLGDVVASWIAAGENKPITPEQVRRGIGEEELGRLAGDTGLSRQALSEQLAKVLPEVVNDLTPEGRLPAEAEVSARLEFLRRR